jgi:hypothetical protein
MTPFQRRAMVLVAVAAILAVAGSLLTWQVLKGAFPAP